MAETLTVTPALLREVAARQSETGSFVSGMAVGSNLTAAGSGLAGMASGDACVFASSVVDEFHRAISGELTDHADKLRAAADLYETTDRSAAERLATHMR